MDKQEMIREMSQHVKKSLKESGKSVKGSPGYITRQQLSDYMAYSDPHSVDWVLSGLERVKRGKHYPITDVAEKIKEGSETRC